MDEITKHYTLVKGLSVVNEKDSPLLEIYGEDYQTVRKIGKKNPRKIWTVLDVGLNYLMVIPGLHNMHRFNYIITEEEWKDENEEYIY